MIEPGTLLFCSIGLAMAIWPYRLAKLGEQRRARARKPPRGSMEPTDRNVTLTRFGGIGMVAFGLLIQFGPA
ncbi:hypothetical protein ACFQE8_16335 [Salinirubellus sp. GCM10025818]|jgi:hypothetical protein